MITLWIFWENWQSIPMIESYIIMKLLLKRLNTYSTCLTINQLQCIATAASNLTWKTLKFHFIKSWLQLLIQSKYFSTLCLWKYFLTKWHMSLFSLLFIPFIKFKDFLKYFKVSLVNEVQCLYFARLCENFHHVRCFPPKPSSSFLFIHLFHLFVYIGSSWRS